MINRIVSPETDTCIEEMVIHNRTSKLDQRDRFTISGGKKYNYLCEKVEQVIYVTSFQETNYFWELNVKNFKF